MSKISVISYDKMSAVQDKHKIDVPIDHYKAAEKFYEEGMNQVLKEMARKHLKAADGFGVEREERYVKQRTKVDKLLKQIGESGNKKNEDLLLNLDSELGAFFVLLADGAYIEGFIAGYKFLKELQPD
ncbi:hypothetical protein [Paenibacillus naphthalenovorans]|uniref:hypothetical protein n=1 Tax=Paenibacillus naphthalenovorans TaxID=162209 RepID=UPI00088FBEF6|nr:hypothetical protein [Paenibacillus naphthalenovorans]SDJ98505.1 hypothetical protein SAMN05421868_1742 [Paenibacillus naphthalenovorans]